MQKMIFDLQRFAEVLHGGAGANQISVTADKTHAYGLAGNDTLTATGKSDVLLIGGSGNDVLSMTGGNGTLSGGKGADTFNLSYSTTITYNGNDAPQLNSVISGSDVIWADSNGYFNLTLKGSTDASDYYDDEGTDYLWEVLKLTNQEREKENLSPLTMSQALSDGAAIRSEEIVNTFSHTRPDGTRCFTVIEKSYYDEGENIASGQTSPEEVMTGWMNSEGHRANILREVFQKIGVGYTYDATAEYKENWVQLFASNLVTPDTISTDNILKTTIEFKADTTPADTTPADTTPADTTPADTDSAEEKSISVKINSETFNVTLENNDAARALKEILPLELNMNELNGNEKYFYLDKNLPSNAEQVEQIHAGDLMLFGSNCIVIFYKDFTTSYSYTRLGTLDNPDDLAEILGDGNVNVAFAESADDFITDTDTLTVDNSIKSPVTLDAAIKIADASSYTKKIKITGNALDNSIVGGSGNDVLDGAAGSDTLNGGKGNDTLRGGDGADVFIYENKTGKDVIDGYGTGDVISLGSGATIKDAYMKGKNAVIKIGTGSITIKNISNTEVTLAQGGAETIFSNGFFINGNSAEVFKSFKGTIDLNNYSSITTADASNSQKSVTLQGGTSSDSLIGGKGKNKIHGGAGNDTLIGGKGNDSLWGDDGANTFIYSKGDGKDVIYGFDEDDTLTLSNLDLTEGTLNKKGTEIYLKVGSTAKAITLKEFDTNEFNINGATYQIENNKLVKQ